MTKYSTFEPSRREFLRRSGQLAISGAGLPFALNLAAMGEAAAFTANTNDPNDYKALVCVFFYGGNDYANTLVPYDNAGYDQYHAIRGGGASGQGAAGIALARDAVLAATELKPALADVPVDGLGVQRSFALNPTMTGLANLFNTGKMAVQLNVGPLVKPLTRAQYNSSDKTTNPRPPQLFSHNDQQSIWQSSSPEGSTIGWGGNMGDLALSTNITTQFTCMSVTGNAVFLSGDTALQYQVSTGGAIKINAAVSGATVYGSSTAANGAQTVSAALRTIIQQTGTHTLQTEYNKVTTRAIAAEGKVTDALKLTDPTAGTPLRTLFPSQANAAERNPLGDQLKMVARLINGRAVLGAQRQVFMVSIGGFDLHDNLIRDHGTILGKVSAAMTAFYDATVEMGIADKVTAFTASDFGRTLASNGDGSDHGWGSHHFVVGGAVKGRKFYGTAPPISVADTKDSSGNYLPANQWHVGQGRLLPSTSVDQYAATLAKWFGVDDAEMHNVLPRIQNYPTATGFNLALPGGQPALNYPRYLGFV